jgi:hypothetical protein
MADLESNAGAAKAEYRSIVIKCDTVSIKTACAFCGADMREGPGPELYLEGTTNAVCYGCGKEYAPELAEAMDTLWKAKRRSVEAKLGAAAAGLKGELLRHYANRKPRRFRQIDGFANMHGDMLDGDGDGYVVASTETHELMRGADVRVLIPFETTQADAASLLQRILGTFERDDRADRPGCALCDNLDRDGGILWDDSRFLCAECWREVAKNFDSAKAAACRPQPVSTDHPFVKRDDRELGFITNAPPNDPYRRWRENLSRLAEEREGREMQRFIYYEPSGRCEVDFGECWAVKAAGKLRVQIEPDLPKHEAVSLLLAIAHRIDEEGLQDPRLDGDDPNSIPWLDEDPNSIPF